MDLISLAVISAGLLLYSLVSGRLQGTLITAPMAFAVFGLVAGAGGFGVINIDVGHTSIHFWRHLAPGGGREAIRATRRSYG